ncbi:diguanylate cyclase/phosphodiesterase (GGDEF & EAL domains) with PAS/PAC sensor(s) [Labilithrix luteola]|uniref:Diguanylate cyclase/phosphodiesterase (GGDEF & EAL domains) with PAS/PAC sensor(S) n=1 Tax=Labilithrix luteola TaxID=1391654 RepID=A0A0K1QFA0_9BACT|nr:EAL domain-containing protein [Labilithrix luteola]AKV04451.1 diguanylate cyclase/phosphodiesterase (GGDEF & EAL domains) with PAS/PAC sensor(s) [Labilithrix luteola]
MAPLLGALQSAVRAELGAIVDQFNECQMRIPRAGVLVSSMSDWERGHLQEMQGRMLLFLTAPDITADKHSDFAWSIGRRHAAVGLSQQDLALSNEFLLDAVRSHVDTAQYTRALAIFAQRLMRDLAIQLDAYEDVERRRHELLGDITRTAWTTGSYTDLIGRVSERLIQHDEIAAVSFGRLDRHGVFRFESMVGRKADSHLQEVERLARGQLVEMSEGPTGRAWRSAQVEHCVNVATDPRMAPWRDALLREGLRSTVAIPVRPPGSSQTLIVGLGSSNLGGFTSAHQTLFIDHLRTLLTVAVARIELREGRTTTVPYAVRQHWLSLVRSEGLEMHYQPILDLHAGRITKVEALARLRDGDRLLSPCDFFPALSPNNFVELYARGLAQALRQRRTWLEQGIDLGISLNLPSSALANPRYLEITQQALAEHACPPQALTLELLESEETRLGADILTALSKFKKLGVGLAEDDLGSGYSSLERLREMPFDMIKIDRSIVKRAGKDSSQILRFIYPLTRLGKSLGKSVVVEGIEDEGMLEAVRILGADLVQGYVVAKPMSGAELRDWLPTYVAPPAPNLRSPRSAPARLARLLVWEERLHLLHDPTFGDEPLGAEAPHYEPMHWPALPFESVPAVVQNELVRMAAHHRPDSVEYQSARQHVVDALLESDLTIR